MILGITGTFASGKDAVGEYLEKKGFEHYSTGDEVFAIAQEKGIKPTRDNLRELANKLRDKYGPEYLSRRVMENKVKTDKVVIAGLRQPGEIKYLQKFPNFHLIAVDAPVELRFKRMRKRARPGDPETIEAMIEKERKEMESKGKNAQKIHECAMMADYTIINDGTFKQLNKKVDAILDKIKRRKKGK
jgi:dephospho-CoA kinase